MLKEKLPSWREVIDILSGSGLELVIDMDNMSARIGLLKKKTKTQAPPNRHSFLPSLVVLFW